MKRFETSHLPSDPGEVAPDGSHVRVLLQLGAGGMAHFELPAGKTTRAVTHRTVEEIWFVMSGAGELWRKQGEHEAIVALASGTCVTIPLGTHFQFRASGLTSLTLLAVTMPPWPADGEAVQVAGPWLST